MLFQKIQHLLVKYHIHIWKKKKKNRRGIKLQNYVDTKARCIVSCFRKLCHSRVTVSISHKIKLLWEKSLLGRNFNLDYFSSSY